MPGLGKMQSSWLGITAGLQMVGVPEIKWVEAGGEQNCVQGNGLLKGEL